MSVESLVDELVEHAKEEHAKSPMMAGPGGVAAMPSWFKTMLDKLLKVSGPIFLEALQNWLNTAKTTAAVLLALLLFAGVSEAAKRGNCANGQCSVAPSQPAATSPEPSKTTFEHRFETSSKAMFEHRSKGSKGHGFHPLKALGEAFEGFHPFRGRKGGCKGGCG